MHHHRRALLAGATASAATVLAPISGIHRLVAKADCLRSLKEFLQEARQNQLTSGQRKLISNKESRCSTFTATFHKRDSYTVRVQ